MSKSKTSTTGTKATSKSAVKSVEKKSTSAKSKDAPAKKTASKKSAPPVNYLTQNKWSVECSKDGRLGRYATWEEAMRVKDDHEATTGHSVKVIGEQ